MRAIWSGTISFGLVSVPVRMFPATDSKELRFHFLHKKDLTPIAYEKVRRDDRKPVDPDEIVRQTPYGIYCVQLGGGQVNTATGDFVFGMTEAYMIENGEVTDPVRAANLIGNGPAVLQSIDAIGNDFETWTGMCGKDGQSVPVSSGQPTVRVSAACTDGSSSRSTGTTSRLLTSSGAGRRSSMPPSTRPTTGVITKLLTAVKTSSSSPSTVTRDGSRPISS